MITTQRGDAADSDANGLSSAGDDAIDLTLHLCGPSKCAHDYSLGEEIENGWTAVCVKCGARAIDEEMWA